MPTRPRIGITPNYRVKDVDQGIPRVDVSSNYTKAILAAGGLPVVLVPHSKNGEAAAYAEMIDGLLLTGGPDIDPARYGQNPHPEVRPLPREREDFDLAVFEAVRAQGKPILGICLGAQEINVALGGTLHQHLPEAVQPYDHEHRWVDREGPLPRHQVQIDGTSRLAKVLGTQSVLTNSSHHQAVNLVAPGLRPVAKTPDGVVEAMESLDGDQILAIQWHPEYLIAEKEHLALFEDLVARARRRAR